MIANQHLFESIFNISDKPGIEKYKNTKQVKEFIELSEKALIKKKKLIPEEIKTLNKLYKHKNVQAFLGSMGARKAGSGKFILGFFPGFMLTKGILGAVGVALGFSGAAAGSLAIIPAMVAGVAAGAIVNGQIVKNDLKKINEEIKELGLPPLIKE